MPLSAPNPARTPPLPGDARGLTSRLGSPALLHAASGADAGLEAAGLPRTSAALRAFVGDYRDRILVAQEIPAIIRAYEHGRLGHARELIELDREWTGSTQARSFSQASRQVGRRQLSHLRPLRDQRVIQRYAAAVDAGQAQGWHVMVYGLALAVFGIPLRSGLLHYAQQTLGGFVDAAPTSHRLSDTEKAALNLDIDESLPGLLQRCLPASKPYELV